MPVSICSVRLVESGVGVEVMDRRSSLWLLSSLTGHYKYVDTHASTHSFSKMKKSLFDHQSEVQGENVRSQWGKTAN